MIRIIRRCFFLAAVALSGGAFAVTCDAVFSNAAGTTGGKLKLKDNASLSNTGDQTLATGNLDPDGNHCDGLPCIESGDYAPPLTLPPNTSTDDLKDTSRSFAPGDYYFDDVDLKNNNTITLTGSGQVRIHVRDDLKIRDDVQINATGDALDLVFLVGDDVDVKGDPRINAFIYADDKFKITGGAILEGAVVAASMEIKDDAQIVYKDAATLAIDGVCTAAAHLHHLRMEHDGKGVTGVPETVTIRACQDVDCAVLYTGSVTVQLQPGNASTSWSGSGVFGNQTTITGGSKTVSLNRTTAGTFDISLSAMPTAANPVRCFIGADESCSITFAENAFDVVLLDQVSAVTSVGSVTLSSCIPEFKSQTMDVQVAAQYLSPATIGPAVELNGNPLPSDGSVLSIGLAFDGSCSAAVTTDYAEAGELGLTFTYTGSGALSGFTVIGSDSPVFYPATLQVQAVNGSGTALNSTLASATPVHAAGAGFNLTVTALNQAGDVTTAYVPQGADRLRAYVRRTGPASGDEGLLRVSTAVAVTTNGTVPGGLGDYLSAELQASDFVNGIYRYAAANYSEVGLVTLYMSDVDYMGHVIAASPLPIGRFVPAGFQLETGAGLVNRELLPGCGDTFTYMGEKLGLSIPIRAVDNGGNTVKNYRDTFAKFNGGGLTAYAGSAGSTLGARSGVANLSNRLNFSAPDVSFAPWSAGLASLGVSLEVDPASAADGPYDLTNFGVDIHDSDGVRLQNLNLDIDGDGLNDHAQIGITSIRAGRVAVGNAHGSELRNLDVPVAVQYFAGSGTGFVTHSIDTCTAIGTTTLADADAGDSLALTDTCIVDDAGASGTHACASGTAGAQYTATPSGGVYVTSLKAPGATKTGGIWVAADVPDWVKYDWSGTGPGNPQGLATFGIYSRESGVIYQREIR